MPFPNQPSRPFTRDDIERLHPEQLGCYGLFTKYQWVYIGKGDIRQRLLGHLNGDNECINQMPPTHWIGEVTAYYEDREKQLITEFLPRCNRKKGYKDRVISRLAELQVKPKCEICDHDNWTFVAQVIAVPVLDNDGLFVLPPPQIPSAGLVCNNCGNIRFFALAALGIDLEGETKQEEKVVVQKK
ncbi:hypothetical protein MYX84_05145 [Acidobacteria bacterium AH-259-O06]|nr:hypothetical protein [Acidobacteria bacterium AH-259-O06]